MGCGFSGAGFTERHLGPRRKTLECSALRSACALPILFGCLKEGERNGLGTWHVRHKREMQSDFVGGTLERLTT